MKFDKDVCTLILKETLETDVPFDGIAGVDMKSFRFHSTLLSELGYIMASWDDSKLDLCNTVHRITAKGLAHLHDFDIALATKFDKGFFLRNLVRS